MPCIQNIPPFPQVSTVPLLLIDYVKLKEKDIEEEQRLFNACIDLGFFYLGNLPLDPDTIFDLAQDVFDQPDEEKVKYDMGNTGKYFGYRTLGEMELPNGTKTYRTEHYNISKDDIISRNQSRQSSNDLLDPLSRSLSEQEKFSKGCHNVALMILSVLESKLGLQHGELTRLHDFSQCSGDQIRLTKSRPSPVNVNGSSTNEERLNVGAHTDFGSVTVLFNRAGGLQVLPPGENAKWAYVKPLGGAAIINLGDALVRLSDGVLRSNVHRVIGAPGEQATIDRYSIVNFVRPCNRVILQPFSSPAIEALKRSGKCSGNMQGLVGGSDEQELVKRMERKNITAEEWIQMKAKASMNWHKSLSGDP